jgi:hypothetical protein
VCRFVERHLVTSSCNADAAPVHMKWPINEPFGCDRRLMTNDISMCILAEGMTSRISQSDAISASDTLATIPIQWPSPKELKKKSYKATRINVK